MKALFNKITQATTAILISFIIMYASVSAQQICGGTIVDAGAPTFKKVLVSFVIGNSCKASPLQCRNFHLLSDFDDGSTCCETYCCNSYNQAAFFSLSSNQNHFMLHKPLSPFNMISSVQTNLEPKSQSAPHKAVPIYILTQSTIC